MSNRFHLALEAGNLENTLPFYTDILGCTLDMKEEGRWQDVDFWGNELTLHQSIPRTYPERTGHKVEMGVVQVPHFGVHLPLDEFNEVKWINLKSLNYNENFKSHKIFCDDIHYTKLGNRIISKIINKSLNIE